MPAKFVVETGQCGLFVGPNSAARFSGRKRARIFLSAKMDGDLSLRSR
jgi:hypothetical protein